MSKPSVVLALALALAATCIACMAWYFANIVPPVAAPPDGVPAPIGPAPVPPPAATTTQVPTLPQKEQVKGLLALPDGSQVAPLNGVEDPPRLVWNNPEYSPIVRTEHNGEYDWYVHADGSYSTTLMIWRSDLGRADAVSYCLHPRNAVPVSPLPPDGAVPPPPAPTSR